MTQHAKATFEVKSWNDERRLRVGVRALGVLAVASGLCLAASAALADDLPTTPPGTARHREGPIERGLDEDVAATGLIGLPAPPLPAIPWLDEKARNLKTLVGHVVVIRSFTNECPFCASTMPALEAIHRDYSDRGVIVLGVYHPKPPRAVSGKAVARFVHDLGLTFPTGIDLDWKLVESWWLSRTESSWTSVTWILDREGRIRYIHPGGEYHPGGGPDHTRCNVDEAVVRETLDRLLATERSAE
jgi:thiol-disulfide isomerase/thioredoxin